MAIYNINIILLANMSLSLKSAYDTSIRKLYVGLLRVCQVSKHHTDPGDRLECQSSVYRLTTVDSRSLHVESVELEPYVDCSDIDESKFSSVAMVTYSMS